MIDIVIFIGEDACCWWSCLRASPNRWSRWRISIRADTSRASCLAHGVHAPKVCSQRLSTRSGRVVAGSPFESTSLVQSALEICDASFQGRSLNIPCFPLCVVCLPELLVEASAVIDICSYVDAWWRVSNAEGLPRDV